MEMEPRVPPTPRPFCLLSREARWAQAPLLAPIATKRISPVALLGKGASVGRGKREGARTGVPATAPWKALINSLHQSKQTPPCK